MSRERGIRCCCVVVFKKERSGGLFLGIVSLISKCILSCLLIVREHSTCNNVDLGK